MTALVCSVLFAALGLYAWGRAIRWVRRALEIEQSIKAERKALRMAREDLGKAWVKAVQARRERAQRA